MAAADTNRKRTCAANFTSINILWNSVCSTRRRHATLTLWCVAPLRRQLRPATGAAVSQSSHAATVACRLPASPCPPSLFFAALSDCLPGCLAAWVPVDIRLDEYLNCLYCWWISDGPRRLPVARSWYGWKCCRGWRLEAAAVAAHSPVRDSVCLASLDKCHQWGILRWGGGTLSLAREREVSICLPRQLFLSLYSH